MIKKCHNMIIKYNHFKKIITFSYIAKIRERLEKFFIKSYKKNKKFEI